MNNQRKYNNLSDPYLNDVANTLIHKLRELYTADVRALAQDFLDSPHTSQNADEAGLLAMLFLEFDSIRNNDLCNDVFQVVQRAQQAKKITAHVLTTRGVLSQEIHVYFRLAEYAQSEGREPSAINYMHVAPPANPLTFLLLDLFCKKLATSYTQQFEVENKKGYLVEAYNHPVKKVPGVWMSIQGVQFDPEEVINY